MTAQIAVRLPEELVEYVDRLVCGSRLARGGRRTGTYLYQQQTARRAGRADPARAGRGNVEAGVWEPHDDDRAALAALA
ncbi:MAG: hypothetical protein M3P83_11795 [Actinomycetota bacterium]|nr:hypothetical protein [Actinomycetota bacterium]